MKRIGIFADLSNLYYSTTNRFNGRKLDYSKYVEFIRELGDPVVMIGYGAQIDREAAAFRRCLESVGFKTKYKKPKEFNTAKGTKHKADWDVGIAVDMIHHQKIDNLDMIILGSGDGDMAAVCDYLKPLGCKIIVIAAGISFELKESCDQVIEIDESLLESKRDKKNVQHETVQAPTTDGS